MKAFDIIVRFVFLPADEGQSSDSGSRIRGFGNTPVKPKPTTAGWSLSCKVLLLHLSEQSLSPSLSLSLPLSLRPYEGDKLKALFGTSGKSPSNTVTYDPNYATLDPVPHNTGTNTPFTPQINSYSSGRYLDGPAPSGART